LNTNDKKETTENILEKKITGSNGNGNGQVANGQGNGNGNGNTAIIIHAFDDPTKVIYQGVFGPDAKNAEKDPQGAGNGNGNANYGYGNGNGNGNGNTVINIGGNKNVEGFDNSGNKNGNQNVGSGNGNGNGNGNNVLNLDYYGASAAYEYKPKDDLYKYPAEEVKAEKPV
jgi:hypothetical protein